MERQAKAGIAIVIVTYNSAGVLGDCLRSITAASDGVRLVRVVVADNASSDGWRAVASEHQHLPIHPLDVGRNAGYAAGVNAGLGAVDLDTVDLDTVDAVLILNPDCRLRPGSLRSLAEALREPGRGIAVPRLVNPDGTTQLSLRRLPTIGRALAESTIGGRLAGRIGTLGELVTDPEAYERPAVAAWATGAAMLLSAAVIREVGMWDESFLHFSEETDYALRARDRGWSLWYEPTAVVEHLGGDSDVNPVLGSLLMVNKVRLFRKRHGAPAAGAYYAIMLFGQILRALTGHPTARASVIALLRPSRRPTALPG
ncbi:MAG: glycosyltransferase family 2 protein [Micromonosporaceae bacterium]|nr:glycosyltransferase family 2 protein [Micromonosporaceae bacterium]